MGHRIFINVHRVQRAYGGPEEGGWWYNRGTCLSSTKTSVCTCPLFLTAFDRDVSELQHAADCGLHATVDETRQEYAGHRDKWIPQETGDESPERVGEVFKTGVIVVSLSAHQGHNYPSRPPTYA